MKFLCDNCKAKYQIADEKVAGKTVRMKCRKCGHQIEVRAAVTEGTGSIPPPAPLPGVRPPPRPGGGLATSLSAQKPKAPAAPAGALAGAFNKNIVDAPASSVSGSNAGGAGSIELSVTDEWYVAINGVPVGPVRISELRRKAATGAVTEESLCWQEGLEEWRPIKSIPDLAQIVREAALGNRPSLADAASPSPSRISGYPSAPKTPAAPARPSTIPPAPVAPSAPMPASIPISAPVATSPMNAPPRPAAPLAPAARSNVVPLRPNAPTGPQLTPSPSMDDLPLGPFGGGGGAAAAFAPSPVAPQTSPLPISSPAVPVAPPAPDPFAAPGPMPGASPFSLTPSPGGSLAPQPQANPMMSSSPSFGDGQSLSRPSFSPQQPSFSPMQGGSMPLAPPAAAPEKKGGTPLWFWPILVLFLGFGGGAAYFVFNRVQPQPVVIQMPATQPATAAPAPTDSATAMDLPASSAETPTIAENTAAPRKATGGGAKKAPAPSPAPEPKGGGLNLEGLGGGVGGPNIGPGSAGGGGGGGLDQAGVERVVSAHRAGVKRTCWERGASDQKSSVNVTVAANVAPNGTVSSVSSSGDDPVVGKCIENQVRTWSFPAPGSQTTINIPFKFVRQ